MYLLIAFASLLPVLLLSFFGCSEKKSTNGQSVNMSDTNKSDQPTQAKEPTSAQPQPPSKVQQVSVESSEANPTKSAEKLRSNADDENKGKNTDKAKSSKSKKSTKSKKDKGKSGKDKKEKKEEGPVMMLRKGASRAQTSTMSKHASKMKKAGDVDVADSGYEMCPTMTPEQLKNALDDGDKK